MSTESEPVRMSAEGDSELEQLTQLYEQTQKAIAAGDLAALARASAGARQAEVDAILANMPAQCRLPWSLRTSSKYRGRLLPRARQAGLRDR